MGWAQGWVCISSKEAARKRRQDKEVRAGGWVSEAGIGRLWGVRLGVSLCGEEGDLGE